ncbi:MAG: hypothetical protein HZB99_04270 [Candidatus Harrisonbacteria bacterium]|nr:hypothetical protein [Candidatus Harrisonbacteria bacterium]
MAKKKRDNLDDELDGKLDYPANESVDEGGTDLLEDEELLDEELEESGDGEEF